MRDIVLWGSLGVTDATEIGCTLGFLVHAKNMADKYPSKALDRDEDASIRPTVHVVQILLNRLIGAYELRYSLFFF